MNIVESLKNSEFSIKHGKVSGGSLCDEMRFRCSYRMFRISMVIILPFRL